MTEIVEVEKEVVKEVEKEVEVVITATPDAAAQSLGGTLTYVINQKGLDPRSGTDQVRCGANDRLPDL